MNNFKKLFSEKIVEPAASSRSSSTITGEVIEANENNNTCKVKFVNIKGNVDTRDNVQVFVYNKSVIDWFPKNKDQVILQSKANDLYIIGPAENNFATIRHQLKLENDIFSDTFTSSIGGYIF